MTTKELRHDGYFLIKIGKIITLYLWSEDKTTLEEDCVKGRRIVPSYKSKDGKSYLLIDGKLVRIA